LNTFRYEHFSRLNNFQISFFLKFAYFLIWTFFNLEIFHIWIFFSLNIFEIWRSLDLKIVLISKTSIFLKLFRLNKCSFWKIVKIWKLCSFFFKLNSRIVQIKKFKLENLSNLKMFKFVNRSNLKLFKFKKFPFTTYFRSRHISGHDLFSVSFTIFFYSQIFLFSQFFCSSQMCLWHFSGHLPFLFYIS
jgi:hypothetical protein